MTPHYRPAREVGGDFYDFIPLPEGRIGLVVGDVTDKGVPAAMVMATTHSILRTDAPRLVDPGAVLSRANELLCAEMPPKMFVTCLYAVLDPATGHLRFANAGHNLPCIHTADGVVEPRATGHAARAAARPHLRGAGGDDRARRARCCSTATAWSRRTIPRASCTGSRASGRSWGAPRPMATSIASGAGRPRGVHRARCGSRRTTSRSCRSRGRQRGAPSRTEPAPARRLRGARATSATSGWPPTGSSTAVAPLELPAAGRRPAAHRRRRGDDERDRARQRVPLGGAGAAARSARPTTRSPCRSSTRAAPRELPDAGDARPRGEARRPPDAARAGACT